MMRVIGMFPSHRGNRKSSRDRSARHRFDREKDRFSYRIIITIGSKQFTIRYNIDLLLFLLRVPHSRMRRRDDAHPDGAETACSRSELHEATP